MAVLEGWNYSGLNKRLQVIGIIEVFAELIKWEESRYS